MAADPNGEIAVSKRDLAPLAPPAHRRPAAEDRRLSSNTAIRRISPRTTYW
jgi:hypothetical protein